jgi:hypothetical protein
MLEVDISVWDKNKNLFHISLKPWKFSKKKLRRMILQSPCSGATIGVGEAKNSEASLHAFQEWLAHLRKTPSRDGQ